MVTKKLTKSEKLHDAFITISEANIDYLSYKGQEKWNQLAKRKVRK